MNQIQSLERLDPPDTASECAICHRVTEDGRDLEPCDEAVDALLDAGAIRRNAAVDAGVQFVCESCLDDLHDAQERHRAEAFDTISDALGLDDCEHPALRARKAIAAYRLRTVQPGEVVVDRSVDAMKDRCVNLLREIVEDLKRFDSPEMRRLAPRTVEAVNEFAFRGWAGLQAIDSARAQATTSGEETPC